MSPSVTREFVLNTAVFTEVLLNPFPTSRSRGSCVSVVAVHEETSKTRDKRQEIRIDCFIFSV